ncbi:hypothetical protein FRC07_000527 [Ceratobasidium sp. 392]|nr:hypothetical protein FRC07_000527 [Ceratobasidium sp. 392]
MSVQQAKCRAVAIMDEAFSEKKILGAGAFKRAKLIAAVERTLESCGAGANARMLDPRVDDPESSPESEMRAGVPTCLRTYGVGASSLPDCTIVEAVCSTFAVPGLFKPTDVVEPGGIKSTYIGLGSFNPMAQLLKEAAHIFQDGHMRCVTSIGTKQKEALGNECERVALEMSERFMNRPGVYCRLYVGQGMESIKTADWERRSDGTTHAQAYLRLAESHSKMSEVVRRLLEAKKGASSNNASRNTIDADLRRIALANNVGDCPSDALTWVARLQERWLIVYNNADDTSLNLRGYFATCSHGSILVTTRNRGMVNIARGIDASCHVSTMPDDEARTLLAKAAGALEDVGSAGEELTKAGAYMQTNMCTAQEYLDMYRTSRGQILEDYASEVQKADDYELTVYATWKVSYQRLTPLARQLFDHLAFMHHDQIVEDIFRFALQGRKIVNPLPPSDEENRIEQMTTEFLANFTSLANGAWDKASFLRATKDLASYSLLTYDSVNRSYSIHPLVQQWTRTVTTDSDTTRSCVALLLASSVIWEYKAEDYAYRRVLLNHIDRLSEYQKNGPRQAQRLALVYRESGRWEEAETLLRELVDVVKRVWGNEHPYTLTVMNNLAFMYSNQGRWDEAEVLLREVVEARKRVRGDEHPETLSAIGNLAATYSNQGRWAEAEVLQRAAVEVRKRVWGSEDPNTLRAVGNLAATYLSQGRWEEAEVLGREVVKVRKRVRGNEHPDTLRAMANLAATYSSQRRWDEAEALLQEVVEVGRRVWGNDHPQTLKMMGNLAAMYSAQGRWDEAGELQQKLLEILKRVRSSDHPETLTAMIRLGRTYSGQERWEKAEDLLCEVLESEPRVRGHKYPQTLIALATVYSSQGRWDSAKEVLEAAVETRREAHGDRHPITLDAMRQLDDVQSQINQLRPAAPTTSSEIKSPVSSPENLYLSAMEDAETSDVQCEVKENVVIHNRRLICCSVLFAVVCCFFYGVPIGPLLQMSYGLFTQ